MKKILFCMIAVGLILAGCSKLIKIQTYDFNISKPITTEQVRDAILAGCEERGWITTQKDGNTISARLLSKGKYEVYVDIIYDNTNYKIEYVKSVNLDATEDKIHKAYAKWINFLQKFINAELFKIN
jgi:hypothetical protein